MKRNIKFLLTVALMAISFHTTAEAWISKEATTKVYSFKFKLNKESFDYEQPAASYEDAFDKAAQACYKHFKGGRRLTEDRGLDIIDVCANPRS